MSDEKDKVIFMIRTKRNAMTLRWLSVSISLILSSCALIPVVSHSMEQSQDKPQVTKVAALPSGAVSKDGIQQQLIAKEKMSWELAIKRDAASYKALHAPDFFTVSGNGVTDRVHSEESALDPNVRFDSCDFSGFRVDVVETNAALVTYRVKAMGFDHEKKFDLDSYAASLWVKRDGEWLNMFYLATPAAQ